MIVMMMTIKRGCISALLWPPMDIGRDPPKIRRESQDLAPKTTSQEPSVQGHVTIVEVPITLSRNVVLSHEKNMKESLFARTRTKLLPPRTLQEEPQGLYMLKKVGCWNITFPEMKMKMKL